MADLLEGTLIDGRYKVVSRLGSGGMADVFLAEDQQLGRKVALKLLHRRFAEDPGFVERFRREAQAAAGLQHPNVVSVYDRGAFDETYYIAMEYLPGRSLKQMIREEAPIDPVRAIDITVQILKAARFAHRRGVIHRDLKPHNVIIDDADHAKVTDFGIARAGASDMTETGSIMGTAQYLSPEQAQGHAVSAGSDLYSVGVVLYELLTGQVPFDAEAAVTIALKHVSESPTPPSAVNPNVPPELEQVVLWALNKNPADRPSDADQFVTALEQARAVIVARGSGQRTTSMAAIGAAGVVGGLGLVAGTGGGAPPAPPSSSVPAGAPPPPFLPAPGDGAGAVTEEPPPPRKRRMSPWVWVVVLLLLLAGGGAAAYLLTRPVTEIVPNVVLQQVSLARTQVQNANLQPNLVYQTDSHASGTVIAQDPLAGKKVNQGSTVTLTVSQGPGSVAVPSVFGLTKQQAEHAITKLGLKVARVVSESSQTVLTGDATRTDPGSGTSLPVGNQVTLFVSSGKPTVLVPAVTNISQQAAETDLTGSNLKYTTTTQDSSTVTPGNVISQNPAANTQVPQGSTVTLVIATKAPPTTASVPNVVGDTSSAAQNNLKTAGFQVSVQSKDTTKQNQDGNVISQSPGSGTTANKNSTVTIVVGKYKAATTTTTSTTSHTTSHTTTHSSTST
jgi:serine/threonine-protein kinase